MKYSKRSSVLFYRFVFSSSQTTHIGLVSLPHSVTEYLSLSRVDVLIEYTYTYSTHTRSSQLINLGKLGTCCSIITCRDAFVGLAKARLGQVVLSLVSFALVKVIHNPLSFCITLLLLRTLLHYTTFRLIHKHKPNTNPITNYTTMSGLFTKLKEAVVGPSETDSTAHGTTTSTSASDYNDPSASSMNTSSSTTSGTGQGYLGGSMGETIASYVPGTEANAASKGQSTTGGSGSGSMSSYDSSTTTTGSGQGYVGGSTGETIASYVPGTQANADSKGMGSSTSTSTSTTGGQGYVGGSTGETIASYVPGTQANAASKGTSNYTSTSGSQMSSSGGGGSSYPISGSSSEGYTAASIVGAEGGEVLPGRANITEIVREELAAEEPLSGTTPRLPSTDGVYPSR